MGCVMHRLTLTLAFSSEKSANAAQAMLEEIFAKEGYAGIAADELHRLGEEAQWVRMSLTSTKDSSRLLAS